MEKAKRNTSSTQASSAEQAPAASFECRSDCASCPLATTGCPAEKFTENLYKILDNEKEPETTEPEKYTVMSEKATTSVVKERKVEPKKTDSRGAQTAKVAKTVEKKASAPRFNNIWEEINREYGSEIESPKAVTRDAKPAKIDKAPKATEKKLHEPAKKTPEQPRKEVRLEKKPAPAPKPMKKLEKIEKKPTPQLEKPNHSKPEKVEKKARHEHAQRPARQHETEEEKPQIFLDELDVRIHDAAPLVFEPVLVVNHERITYTKNGSKPLAPSVSPEQLTPNDQLAPDQVETARSMAAQVYERYAEEITDIDREAQAVTVAYERTRDPNAAEPFIERANVVNNQLLSSVDIEHDIDSSDVSDSLPPLAIDGITDPSLGIEQLKPTIPVTTTNTSWLARLKLKLARFLLRNVA